jgi:hypothetical protein
MRPWLKWSIGVAATGIAIAASLFAWFVWLPVHSVPALEHVDEYVWLDQGWGADQNAELRQRFYYTPQGTSLPQGASRAAVRYRWFVNLELPWSTGRFAAPDHLRRYRFIVDPAPSPTNPDQLPVGFTRCSTSAAPPATRRSCISPATAGRARYASTAAPPCMPSPT